MRVLDLLMVVPALVLAAMVAFGPSPGATEEMAGQVWIIDGDTLQIEQKIVHLAGIDAPELGQRCLLEEKEWRCGLEAALALRKLVAFGGVVCSSEHEGTLVSGRCTAAGKDLAEVLVSQGYAMALPDAFPAYQAAETAAQDAKLGLWRGDFVRPADWRRGARLPGETTDTVFCVVKGTVTEKDQKLFLIPSDDDYHSREIDPARGERMFCSDDEAILAGWTRFPRERP